jgi:uncharacterized RDD family membrane protein YckC/energy-coupling factor transporter ATP-binding protein EcfA2
MNEQQLESNPYVGLRPFYATDSLYFYGRDQQTEELLEILRHHHFLGVVGSSGSGKSSLVRAGLLPALLGGFLVQDRDQWSVLQVKPGDEPIGNLSSGLLEAMKVQASNEEQAAFQQSVRDGHTAAIIDFLGPRLDSNANLFVLVDQFEEIFAFRGADAEEDAANLDLPRRTERARRKAEATDYVSLLLDLAEQRQLPIYVVLTMRTDFLGDCDRFHRLPEALNRGRYLVPRLTRAQLRDAVECPALLLGTQVTPRLLDHVSNELGDRFDRLPVLQHALLRAWDEWERAGGIGAIDLQHFKSAGGLSGSLALDAEAALDGLDLELTARLFKRLTDTDVSRRRIRSPARISELMEAADTDQKTVEKILHCFEKNGRNFVHRSADGKPGDPRVDISHESLIRQWIRLRDWVDEERRSRNRYQELVTRASRYADGDVPLLQGPELQIAINWRSSASPTSGWARRYSHRADEFESAKRYIDDSISAHEEELRAHNTDLAEKQVSGRWQRLFQPLLWIEIIIGLWLASDRGAARNPLEEDAQSLISLVGEFVDDLVILYESVFAELAKAETVLNLKGPFYELFSLIANLIYDSSFVMLLIYVGLCVALNRYATYLYRSNRLPRVLEAIESGSWKVALAGDELPDARDARSFSYATPAQRVSGWITDSIRQSITAAMVCFLGIFIVAFTEGLIGLGDGDITDGGMLLVIVAMFFANWWRAVSPIVSEAKATHGMLKNGIQRVDRFGGRLTYGRATVWYFARFLSAIYFWLGFLMQPFMPKRQTFHDWVARTVVLQTPLIEDEENAAPKETCIQ